MIVEQSIYGSKLQWKGKITAIIQTECIVIKFKHYLSIIIPCCISENISFWPVPAFCKTSQCSSNLNCHVQAETQPPSGVDDPASEHCRCRSAPQLQKSQRSKHGLREKSLRGATVIMPLQEIALC